MFVLQDMMTELAAVAAVLVAVVLGVSALAALSRDGLERRSARKARQRLRKRVWRDYAAACAPAQTPAPAPRTMVAPASMVPACAARDRGVGLTAGPSEV